MTERLLEHYLVVLVSGLALALVLGCLSPAGAQVDVVDRDRVRALVLAGEDERALELLRGASDPELVYLRGRLLERASRFSDAADALSVDGSGFPGTVREDAIYRRARALARINRCEDAERLISGFDNAQVRALRAECVFRRGAHADAIPLLWVVAAEDAADVDTFAVGMMLAESQHRSGDLSAELATLRRLLVEHPLHPDVSLAESLLRARVGAVALSRVERLMRAERMLALREPRRAIEELDLGGRPLDSELLGQWLHQRGMALFGTRNDYAEAAQVLAEAASLGGAHEVDDAFHAARALSRSDQEREAIAAYRALARRHRGHPRAVQAEFLAAWFELHLGLPSGSRNMDRFLEGAGRGTAFADRARWHLGFSAYEQGDDRKAIRYLEPYAQAGDGPLHRARGFYWLGRARARSGDRSGAEEAFRQAIQVDALHWYGLWARHRLIELGEEAGPIMVPSSDSSALLQLPPLPSDVAFYHRLGLRRDAAQALRRSEAELRRAAGERAVEVLIHHYGQVVGTQRAYILAERNFRDALAAAPTDHNRWVWNAAYPRPYLDIVHRVAESYDLPAELFYAIMRQESGYDPDAVSYADAIGLLQLLPSTASALVTATPSAEFSRGMLFEPAWNIRLAGGHLAEIRTEVGDHAPDIIAAYNAGSHRVLEWRARFGDLEPDQFVERIGIDQTRDYVRRVMSHYARYRFASDPTEPIEITTLMQL